VFSHKGSTLFSVKRGLSAREKLKLNTSAKKAFLAGMISFILF